MPSIEAPMLWVYGTHDDTEHKCAIVLRDGEGLEDAMARGCAYILDGIEGASVLTKVWTGTMDEYEYERFDLLMDGQFSGRLFETETMR